MAHPFAYQQQTGCLKDKLKDSQNPVANQFSQVEDAGRLHFRYQEKMKE